MLEKEREYALRMAKSARSVAQSARDECDRRRTPSTEMGMVRGLAQAVDQLADVVTLLVEDHRSS